MTINVNQDHYLPRAGNFDSVTGEFRRPGTAQFDEGIMPNAAGNVGDDIQIRNPRNNNSSEVEANVINKLLEDLSKSIETGDADKAKEIITALKAEVGSKNTINLYKMKTGKNLKEDIGKNISSATGKYTKIAGAAATGAAIGAWFGNIPGAIVRRCNWCSYPMV